MFQPVSPKPDFKALEEQVLAFWKDRAIFHRSMHQRQAAGGKSYVFFEGPPTANGKPGIHHVLARVFKDMFPRYRAMRGDYVLRRGGWDTHGLPVEIEVEKKLGFSGKQDIEKYGVAEFNKLCRQSAFEYIKEWERLTDRIAFWVDLDTAYITYENNFIESVWHILKNFWSRDLLYRGYKVVPYCPRCGTPLSDHEVALGYNDETVDPSVFVRFKVQEADHTYFLVWTTTPWTLPGNVALAVHPSVTYAYVEHTDAHGQTETLILAEALLDKVFRGEAYRVVRTCTGADLAGMRYEPLFTFLPLDKPAHRVVTGDFVTVDDGTGVVHQAPAFGAEDMQMARDHDLPVLMTVQADGCFVPEVTDYAGLFFKEADPRITDNLRARGLLYRAETFTHTYPFCWRCSTPLLYFARATWYIRTTQFRDRLVALNRQINWVPDHIREGRFGNWLENNIDWALGRERYWGTPLPVWVDESGDMLCVGSLAELSDLAGRDLTGMELHRPYVDDITFPNPKTGLTMRRVPELIDVWFDSGAMPYAQWHYPFEHQAEFAAQFPADYICEAVDQTRGWFYSLHAISTLYQDSVAYKNVICLGHILDGNGQKMSKSKGNIVNPWDVIQAHGADATRWYMYTATPPGNPRRFSIDLVGEVVRNLTLPLWNAYSFFVTYANLAEWTPPTTASAPSTHTLDRWILSALHALTRDLTAAYEAYDVTGATRPVEKFVDDLTNWYLRRSRRRFWDGDPAALNTLYECLLTLSQLLAPAMPFLADVLYRNLALSVHPNAPESVHLTDWPAFEASRIDEQLNADMRVVMKLASLGLGARNKANRKVRQPLAEAAFAVGQASEQSVVYKYADLLADELNVKQVRVLGAAGEAVTYTLNPLPKQLGQKYGGAFPALRKAVLALEPEAAARALLNSEPVTVTVADQTYTLLPEEVEVRANAKAGFAVMAEGAYLAALHTELTPELVREGLAREFVRRVQDLRKTAGFDISDRITVHYQASETLAEAVAAHAEYIKGETLALELFPGHLPAEAPQASDTFDAETLTVAVVKATNPKGINQE